MLTDLIAKCRMSVGQVICRDFNQTGSGFFISEDGWLLTNNHVIHRIEIDDKTYAITVNYSKEIYVKSDKGIFLAHLLLNEESDRPVVYDYAVLKIDSTVDSYLTTAEPREIHLGEDVIAVGFPLDFEEPIFTKGVISSIVVRPSRINSLHKVRTVLTDALITYGSSGGPLVRVLDEQVIGINSMPHLIKDLLLDRLYKYLTIEEVKNNIALHDLIKFVCKYTNLGYNHAISIEYACEDPVMKSLSKGD